MIGGTLIQLKGHEDEYYYFDAPKAVVHNLIVGKLWIDHVGDVSVICLSSDRKTDLHFKQCGWFGKGYREFTGSLLNSKGKEMFKLQGKWNSRLIATRVAKSKIKCEEDEYIFEEDQDSIIWKNNDEYTKDEFKKWKFTEATVKLCDMNERLIAKLPCSDSRFRPDRISLQNRDVKKAGKDKHRLEDLQRRKRKFREKNGLEFAPKYFEKSTINDIEFWQFNGVYDKERKDRIKQSKKNKGKDIETEFDVDPLDLEVTEVEEERSSSETAPNHDGEVLPLPEPDEVPDDM